jgi:hypothetical protein
LSEQCFGYRSTESMHVSPRETKQKKEREGGVGSS